MIPAGPELDRRVAAEVMGYRRLDDGVDRDTGAPFERWDYGRGKYSGIPSFSTSIEAAFEAASKVDLFKCARLWQLLKGSWVVEDNEDYPTWRVEGDTPAHAICLAALETKRSV